MRPVTFTKEKAIPNSRGRAGVIYTPHGVIETPAFTVVGTKATVKGVAPEFLKNMGVQAVLANTYHLYLQPGEDIVAEAGGLNKFMRWDGPTLTDSGGFQVFSLGAGFEAGVGKFATPEQILAEDKTPVFYDKELATSHGKLAIVDEEGVTFTSHHDGTLHRLTAERSIEIQHKLGADIMFAFDECTSPLADHTYQKEAMARTHRWAERSLKAHRQNIEASQKQGLYGVVQGGRFEDLRKESAKILADMDFDGYGIGGSFSKEDLVKALDVVVEELPEDKPRHLLGIGEPEDIFIGVEKGMDTFDCVAPTRLGRNGTVYTKDGKTTLRYEKFLHDQGPIDEGCVCYACANFPKSYITHLLRAGEHLGGMLASIHNLYFIVNLVKDIRTSILEERFESFRDTFMQRYAKSNG